MSFPYTQYDVVLVQPPAEVIREEYDTPNYPAIGIAYVGGYLERQTGIIPAVLDARLACLNLEETITQIIAFRPRIVGLSAMTHMVLTANIIATRVKAVLPEVTVVLGGFHATFLPERTIEEFPALDAVIVGEGEIPFVDIVQRVLADKPYCDLSGICAREGDRVRNNGRAPIPDSLDEFGTPAWHLFDQEAMHAHATKFPIMGQRGCPFHCNFCSRPYGRKVRRRTPALIADEIASASETYGVKEFIFYDETLTVHKAHTIGLCREMVARDIKEGRISWQCSVHANVVDEKIVRALKAAGCNQVGFGVESGDDDIIKNMKKGVTKERILKARRIFKEVGIPAQAFFLLGHPNETKKTLWNTVKFAVRLNAETTAIGLMVPYPGTDVWEMAIRGEGGYRKLSSNWQDFNKQLGNAVELEHVSRRWMEVFQVIGYVLIYLVNLRFNDLFRQIVDNLPLARAILFKIILPASIRKRFVFLKGA